MIGLDFLIIGARAEQYAATPTIVFRLKIRETTGTPIHAVALECQVRIEARRRVYSPAEQAGLSDLFGAPERLRETLGSFFWTRTVRMVPAFEGSVEVDLAVACTYDLEVTAAKYFQALEGGEIPLLFLFSGTVFARSDNGFQVERVAWDREAAWRLPVRTWRELMDAYFPGCGWLRLRREALDALRRFKSERALMTWDDAVEALMECTEAVKPR